jgi:hypothetical protein
MRYLIMGLNTKVSNFYIKRQWLSDYVFKKINSLFPKGPKQNGTIRLKWNNGLKYTLTLTWSVRKMV